MLSDLGNYGAAEQRRCDIQLTTQEKEAVLVACRTLPMAEARPDFVSTAIASRSCCAATVVVAKAQIASTCA